ncbi:hypothetical protein EUBSIR_02713 [[Eubacterium] siraeum DSM 15702]|uniref:Uncharacterized protein n=1 Tax=[Eubacterium] siraeum DSM 15702 TaxID=428128 RepID=B0MS76_9FIRM|nr:hypothetical protein EUBSIR_02713 [[Eubacterium] siraeum DSM 15702]
MQLLSKYTSHNLHSAEQSSPAIPAKENCVTKKTAPQCRTYTKTPCHSIIP